MSDSKSPTLLLEELLEKIRQFQQSQGEERRRTLNRLMLSDGYPLCIDSEVDRSLREFSESLLDCDFSNHGSRFTDSDWHHMVRKALGNALCVELIGKTGAKETTQSVLAAITSAVERKIGDFEEREFTFGCHFADIPDLEPLEIGPVLFEPRDVWLERVHREGEVSKISRSRIERAWEGKRLCERVDSRDAAFERGILRTIGSGGYVCSVSVGLAGKKAGLQKALVAARLAMASVALTFEDASRVLKFMVLVNDERRPSHNHIEFSSSREFRSETSLSFSPGGVPRIPGGVHKRKEHGWRTVQNEFADQFASSGKAIRWFTHGEKEFEQPKTMSALFSALLWFYEGATETTDPMAIVKFCSSMEALTRGKGKEGIKSLVAVHFPDFDKSILDAEVEQLYGKGRNPTVHGKSSHLGDDWSSKRAIAEHLARVCLLGCLKVAAESGSGADDPKVFLTPPTSSN